MAGMRKPLPVAWAVFDGIDRMHIAKGYSEAESCAEDIGGEIVPLYRSPRWIPVSERLPETSGNVIIAWLSRASVGRHKKTLVGAAYFANGTFEHLEADFQVEPTHWMPFPEPPAD
jgi:hypothetical protein